MANTDQSPQKWPFFSDEEVQAAQRVLTSGNVNYWTGSQGKSFEQEFANYVGTKHAVAVSNGTVAIELALEALNISPGDEVIIPSCTFIATASAVVMRGAIPIIADIEPYSLTLSRRTIEAVHSPKTKAIICVHLAGNPCEMADIMAFATEHNCVVIEDCAQAHGARYNGQVVGSIGHIGAFSFCQDKIMTTGGEGGMVVTNDESLWKRAWEFKDHGKSYDAVFNKEHPPGFRWLHESFGTNFRMTEMQSAIGRVQLSKLDDWLHHRKQNALAIWQAAQQVPCLVVPTMSDTHDSAYYKCYVFVDTDKLADGWNRDRIMSEINALGTPCFSGSCTEIYNEKCFEQFPNTYQQQLPNAHSLGKCALMFLIDPSVDASQIEHTVSAIQTVGNRASQ